MTFMHSQFEKPPPKVPYKAIILATVLFLGGTILIVIGALLLSGYIPAKVMLSEHTDMVYMTREQNVLWDMLSLLLLLK